MTLFEQAQNHLSHYSEQKKLGANSEFFSMSLDAMCEHLDATVESEKNLITVLSEMDFSGIVATTSYGKIALSPSSKMNGFWQVTTFNPDLIPLGDFGVVKKDEAIKQFLNDLGHTIDVQEICNQIRPH